MWPVGGYRWMKSLIPRFVQNLDRMKLLLWDPGLLPSPLRKRKQPFGFCWLLNVAKSHIKTFKSFSF
jgi:hypothetical protein